MEEIEVEKKLRKLESEVSILKERLETSDSIILKKDEKLVIMSPAWLKAIEINNIARTLSESMARGDTFLIFANGFKVYVMPKDSDVEFEDKVIKK